MLISKTDPSSFLTFGQETDYSSQQMFRGDEKIQHQFLNFPDDFFQAQSFYFSLLRKDQEQLDLMKFQ